MTLRKAIRAAAAELASVSDTARLDAELLAAFALGVDRETLLLGGMDGAVPNSFAELVVRRRAAEPIAYIIGSQEFWSLRLSVSPDVLIPRPDSETLIEAAVDHFRGTSGPRSIIDLGTGSGALLLAALAQWPDARGLGVDRSHAALKIAQANAQSCGFADRALLERGDWASNVQDAFDLVLCNPPYIAESHPLMDDVIRYEPHAALFGGEDGLVEYRRLAPQIARLLTRTGCACVEIGHDQAQRATSLFQNVGLKVDLRADLGGRDRCLVLTQMA